MAPLLGELANAKHLTERSTPNYKRRDISFPRRLVNSRPNKKEQLNRTALNLFYIARREALLF